MQKKRDISIDIVRALAIVLMVAANMGILTHDEPPWVFRFIFSIAAPMFLILAGMMVSLGIKSGLTFSAIAARGAFIFVLAGLLDVINLNMPPFVHFDVLYLIGLSLPLVFLMKRFSNTVLLIIIAAILCITPYLQTLLGYRFLFDPLPTGNIASLTQFLIREIPQRYLVDGWFPILPWFSMLLFGALLGRLRYHHLTHYRIFTEYSYILSALLLIGIGSIIWWFFPGGQGIRSDYAELFYPPVSGFMLLAMGVTLSILILVDWIPTAAVWKVILPLGEASLFMYIFHLILIKHLLLPMGTIDFGTRYLTIDLILLVVMIGAGFALRKLHTQTYYKRLPHFVRMILGS